MFGTLYKIRAHFTADTRGAEKGAERVAKKTGHAADEADRARGSFRSLGGILKSAFAGGAVAGLGVLTRYVGQLASEAENAEISIASIFSVNKLSTFNDGLKRARGLMERFNRASKQSPGEGRDFLNIFQRTAPTLAKFNPNDKEITTFAGRALAAAFSFNNGDVDLTGDQISQILQGQGGADNKTFNALKGSLFRELGIKAAGSKGTEAFNKLAAKDPKKIFGALNNALASLDEANKAFGQTFTGMFGSLKQTVNSTLKTAFEPLFSRVKSGFADFLGFLDRNEEKISDLAATIGDKLAGAWDSVRKAIQFVNDNLSIFIALGTGAAMKRAVTMITMSSIGGVGVGPMAMGRTYMAGARATKLRAVGAASAGASRALTPAANFAADFLLGGTGLLGASDRASRGARLKRAGLSAFAQSGGSVIGAGGILGRQGAGALAGRARAGLGSLRTRGVAAYARAGSFAGMVAPAVMGGGKAGLLKAGAAMKALAGGASTLGTALLPLIVITGMIAGAFRVLKDEGNEATIFLRASWKELRQALDTLAGQFGFEGSGGFGSMVKKFVDWLGTGVVGVFGLVVKAVERVVTAFTYLVAFFKGFAKTIDEAITKKSLSGFGEMFSKNLEAALEERRKAYIATFDGGPNKRKRGELTDAEKKFVAAMRAEEAAKAAKAAKPPVNVTVKNETRVITEADPDKIAIALDRMTASSLSRALDTVEALPGF